VNSARFSRAEAIFHAALERSGDDRAAFIDAECAEDEDLRAMVLELVALDERPHAMVQGEDPGASHRAEVAVSLASPEAAGAPERIGPFRIIRLLGQGGMGTVWLAEQEHPRRQVALKVLRGDGLSRGAQQRFEREAMALGRLRHPGIAAIYEAGQDAGVAYFAMEYVPGESLTHFIRQGSIDLRRRVELLAQVCDAVQHAHDQGVIHRDLKPSNILVDEGGRPRVLDFGVARIVAGDVAVATLQTDVGQLVGTIPYMSPEQVRGEVLQIDARTDVWALGVIGYEILADRLPHDLRDRSIPDAVRIIAEMDPPSLGTISRAHRGDLATIFSKALDRDRGRRYASAAALARDLRRFLADEPIEARPPSATYQLRKFARRHRAWATALLVAAICLIGATVFSGIAAMRATRARNDAVDARTTAEANERLAKRLAYRAGIAAADARLQLREIQTASAALEAIDPSRRGEWEYRYLKVRLDDARIVIESPTGPISSVGFVNGGREIFGVGFSTHGWSYELDSGRISFDESIREGRIRRLLPLGGGAHRLYAGADGRVWITEGTGAELGDPALVLSSGVIKATADQSGEFIALQTVSRECRVYRRNGRTLVPVCVRDARHGAISLDARRLVTLRGSRLVVDRIEDGVIELDVDGKDIGYRDALFTPDGKHVIAIGEDGSISNLSLEAGVASETRNVGTALNQLVIAENGSYAAILTRDAAVLVWDLTTNRERAVLLGHRSPLLSAAISPDSSMIATSSVDGTIRLWDPGLPKRIVHQEISGSIRELAAARSAPMVALGLESGGLEVIALPDLQSRWTAPAHLENVLDIVWLHDDNSFISVSTDGKVREWRASDGVPVAQCSLEPRHLSAVEVRADGALVACGSSDGQVTVLSRIGGVLSELDRWSAHHGWVRSLAFSPDGSVLLSTGDDGRGVLWQVSPRHELAALDGHSGIVHQGVFSPHAGEITTAGADGKLRVWDVATRSLIRSAVGSPSAISAIAYAASGTRIAGSCADGRIRIWDTATLDELLVLKAHESPSFGVAFAAEDELLMSGGQDERVVVWRAPRAKVE